MPSIGATNRSCAYVPARPSKSRLTTPARVISKPKPTWPSPATTGLRPLAPLGQSHRRPSLCRRRQARRRSGGRPSSISKWTPIPGSRSAPAAALSATRRAGPNFPAVTRPKSSNITPAPAAPRATALCTFNDKISWPITPFVGTFGVAPDREVTTSLDGQGEWGGNLDIRDAAPGNKLYLPIFHDGALFYLGDVHASQGDTEFTGTAAETKATVRLKLDLLKDKRVPWIRIEKPASLIAIDANRPLEVAVETATFHLMDWLITDHGFTPTDAYCLVSTCPDFRINVYQMCKIGKLSFVAGAEIPKRFMMAHVKSGD